jgi:intracellular sulfur oxidation DsrE/DsrF family protein
MTPSELRIVLHAPTVEALARARRNATNLAQEAPDAIVRILVNGQAVAATLDDSDEVLDRLTLICPNSLKRIGRTAAQPLTVLQEPGVLALARLQSEGWQYIRA